MPTQMDEGKDPPLDVKNLEKFGKLLTHKENDEERLDKIRNRERPQRNTMIILHYSNFKMAWDWVVLTLTYYTAVVVPLVAAFQIKDRSIVWLIIDSTVDVFFIADVIINFYTTRAGSEGEIVTDLKTIRIKYIKSWFLLDVLTCIPYDAITMSTGNIKTNAQLLGSMKAFRLFRLVRIVRDLDRYLAHAYASLIVLMSLILLLCHWMGCGWYNVALVDAKTYMKNSYENLPTINPDGAGSGPLRDANDNLIISHDIVKGSNDIFFEATILSDGPVHKRREVERNVMNVSQDISNTNTAVKKVFIPKNWLIQLGEDTNREFFWDPKKEELGGGPTLFSTYSLCLYFTMTAVISQGFGNIYGDTFNEQIYCIFILLVGCLLYATILANVTTAMETISARAEQLDETFKSIRKFAKLHDLPKHLLRSMNDYVYFYWTATHGISERKVLDWLPKHMELDSSIYLHRHVMTTQTAFKILSETSSRHIASKMEKIHIAPGDLLIDRGEEIEYLYFVISGSLEILQDDQIVGLLGSCDSFGTKFWSLAPKKKGYVVSECAVHALTYVDLEIIRGEDVINAMKFHPDIQRSFFRIFNLSYDIAKKLEFKTTQGVDWMKKVDEDPKIAKKDRKLKKWLRKTRNNKVGVESGVTQTKENKDTTKQDFKTPVKYESDVVKKNTNKESTKKTDDIGREKISEKSNSTLYIGNVPIDSKNLVELIPLSMPIEEYYNNQKDFTQYGNGIQSDIVTTASIYDVSFSDDGTTQVRHLPSIKFSLESGDWMTMELPTEIKEILLSMLKLRSEGICKIKAFKDRLDKCEENVDRALKLVERLYGR